MSHLLITGPRPKGPPGTVPPRLNIIDFVKEANIKQFSLYIQALNDIYGRADTIIDSYYQLSGVHGKPYVEWNSGPGWQSGYCVHGNSTFSTWHRAYVSVFEQVLHDSAIKIAESYTVDPDQWKAAAQSLRQPYWGWDKQANVIPPPEVISMNQLQIILAPGNNRTPVTNPFLKYSFRPGETNTFSGYYQTWQATARAPDDNGVTNVDNLKASITARASNIEARMAVLYAKTDWTDFVMSLNSNPHGAMHNAVGGVGVVNRAGHMAAVEVAGFDPIFWLHHSQVDRVIDTWYQKHGKWETSTNGLTPFWKTQTAFWTSPDNDMIKTDVYLNYKYDATLAQPLPRVPGGTLHDWRVRIKSKQFELGGSFSVCVFLGHVPGDHTGWFKHHTLCGIYDVFANAHPEECANCTEHRDVVLESFLFLNHKYLEKSGHTSLEPEVVVPYLKGKLNWGIKTADGRIPHIGELPSLEVTVYKVTLTEVGGVVKQGEREYYHEITRGQPGGHRIA